MRAWCAVLQVRLPEANVSASHEAGRRRMGDGVSFAGAPRVFGATAIVAVYGER